MSKRKSTTTTSKPRAKKMKIEDDSVITYAIPLVRSLKYLSCIRISTSLWGHYDLEEADYTNVKNSLSVLNLPPAITNLISNHLKHLGQKLRRWANLLESRLHRTDNSTSQIYRMIGANIDYIVWASDGEIDRQTTLLNLSSRGVFNEVDKESLISLLLGENNDAMYASIFAGSVDEPIYQLRSPDADGLLVPALVYRMQLKMDLDSILQTQPVNVKHIMSELNDVQNIQIIDYIWSRLDEAKQVEFASNIIRKYGMKFQTRLLSKMTAAQQRLILKRICIRIIQNFAEESHDYALITWMRVKDTISAYHFFKLLESLIMAMRTGFVDDHNCLMIDIWKSASSGLRRYALSRKEHCEHRFLFVILFHCPRAENCTNIAANVEFLIHVLSDADPDLRKRTLLSETGRYYCQWLFKEGRTNLLDPLVDLCLTDDEEKVKFKDLVLNPNHVVKDTLSIDWLATSSVSHDSD